LQGIESALERLEREHPESTWTDAARTGFAETLLNSPAARDSGTVERLAHLTASARGGDARRRLQYYTALAAYQTGDMEQVASLLAPLAESGEQDPIYRDSQYLRGMALARLARWEDAVGPLETFLKQDQRSPQARSAIVQLALALAKAPKVAERDARFAAALDAAATRPDASEVLLEAGNLLFSKGSYESAAAAYARSNQASPGEKNPSALLGLAWSEFELGKSDPARKQSSLDRFRQAAEAAERGADSWAEALYMQGVVAAELGRPADAVAPLSTVVDDVAESKFAADAGQRLARILTDLGRSDEADGVYAKLLERTAEPGAKSKLLFDRAWLALRRQDGESAEKLFRQTADAGGPFAAESALKLAETAHARGDYSASVEWTRRAEALNPPPALLPAVFYRRGLSQVHLGKGDEARASLALVVERHPEDPLVSASLFWLGEVEFAGGRFEAAIERYRQILDRGEKDKYASLARLRSAQCHFQSGRLDDAARTADELLEVCDDAPTRDEAMYLKGRVLQQRAKFDEAREVYRQVVRGERTESAAKAQFMIGETFFFQERYDEALKELLKVQILYPIPTWQAAALLEIGKLHEKRGEIAEALAAYETVVNDFPNEPAAPEAKQRRRALVSTPSAEQ
jgi:TolA-binding protein